VCGLNALDAHLFTEIPQKSDYQVMLALPDWYSFESKTSFPFCFNNLLTRLTLVIAN
jgi:hypothetical protein